MRVLDKLKKPEVTRILAGALGLLLALTLVVAFVAPVSAIPQLPHQFWGTVYINSTPAPEGTEVVARIAGVAENFTTVVDADHWYGWSPEFKVKGDDPDTPEKEGGNKGDTIEFYVAGTWATNFTFNPGGGNLLNLGEVPTYNLTINSTAGGNVTTPGEDTFTYNASEVVNLVAEADTNYTFVNWTGDVDTVDDANSNITNITMNADYNITANFAPMPVLNVTASTANVTAGVPTDVTFNVTTDGTAVNSATVNLSGVATGTNTTGGDGLCIISVNATSAGTINVTASKTGYVGDNTTITAEPMPVLNVTATPNTVTVSVPKDVTFNVTSDGAAVEGATVNLSGVATGTNTTGADGLCLISVNATSEGTLNVTASKTDYLDGTTTIMAVPRYLNVTATPNTVTVSVPKDVTFNVTSDGAAVEGATVNLTGVATGTNTTGADGLCLISVNATSAGIINVTASKTGYVGDNTTITAGYVTWNCPVDHQVLISPYPKNGRATLSVAANLSEVTTDADWFQVLWLNEETGGYSYFVSTFPTGNTLTQLEPSEFYLVIVSAPCKLTIPQG